MLDTGSGPRSGRAKDKLGEHRPGEGLLGTEFSGAAIPLAIGSLPASGWCDLCLSGRSLLVLGKGSAGRPGMYLATFYFL